MSREAAAAVLLLRTAPADEPREALCLHRETLSSLLSGYGSRGPRDRLPCLSPAPCDRAPRRARSPPGSGPPVAERLSPGAPAVGAQAPGPAAPGGRVSLGAAMGPWDQRGGSRGEAEAPRGSGRGGRACGEREKCPRPAESAATSSEEPAPAEGGPSRSGRAAPAGPLRGRGFGLGSGRSGPAAGEEPGGPLLGALRSPSRSALMWAAP